MATQSEPSIHAPVTLRGSVENLSYLPQVILTPQEGRVGCETQRSREQSKLAMAGKAAVPEIS